MSNIAIKIYSDPILRKKAGIVKSIGEKERKLAYDMIETMRSANGIGLAAPQVGVSKQIIVIEAMEKGAEALVFINPKVLEKRGKSSFCEGCLSVPGITSDIVRPESVAVEALNLEGEVLKIRTGGLLARVIQHEVDHLDGILFIDKAAGIENVKFKNQN